MNLGLAALAGLLTTATFDASRMAAAADAPEAATAAVDLAEWLVAAGMPFRQAHHVVAGLVGQASAGDASLAQLVAAHPQLGPEAAGVLEPGAAVRRRTTAGGAGPQAVDDQLRRFSERLDLDAGRMAE